MKYDIYLENKVWCVFSQKSNAIVSLWQTVTGSFINVMILWLLESARCWCIGWELNSANLDVSTPHFTDYCLTVLSTQNLLQNIDLDIYIYIYIYIEIIIPLDIMPTSPPWKHKCCPTSWCWRAFHPKEKNMAWCP